MIRPVRSCSSSRCASSTAGLLGLELEILRFDLSLENRRATENAVCMQAAEKMRETGLGLKAATVTPEGADDVGSPNRLLREAIDGKVIVRTGSRIPGVTAVAGVHHPISVCRMAVGDAYGAEQWREAEGDDELAHRTETIRRSDCRAVAEYAFREAERMGGRVYGGPKWTVSPVYEGMLKEEMDAAAERHPDCTYQPVLIDATLAGLVSGPPTSRSSSPASTATETSSPTSSCRCSARSPAPSRCCCRSTPTCAPPSPWPRRRTERRRRSRARTSQTRWR